MREIDARGQDCPKPVIMTKKALDESGNKEDLTTIVDNAMSKENVTKLLQSMNIECEVEEVDGDFYIKTVSLEDSKTETSSEKSSKVEIKREDEINRQTVIMFDKDKMGHGNDELGDVLIKGFIYALTELDTLPSTLLFINSGIRLTTEGSSVIEDIKTLEERGVEILSCGTCLDYYNMQDKLRVGGVTNMYMIVEKLMNASNSIKL